MLIFQTSGVSFVIKCIDFKVNLQKHTKAKFITAIMSGILKHFKLNRDSLLIFQLSWTSLLVKCWFEVSRQPLYRKNNHVQSKEENTLGVQFHGIFFSIEWWIKFSYALFYSDARGLFPFNCPFTYSSFALGFTASVIFQIHLVCFFFFF